MEGKNLRQLIASAQLELNRLATKEKALTRKEKTHRKIVLGGEVAKYMGLDIDQDMLVGFLMTYATTTEEQRNRYISNGGRARQNENLRKENDNKNSVKKQNSKNASAVNGTDTKENGKIHSMKNSHFFDVLSKQLNGNKNE